MKRRISFRGVAVNQVLQNKQAARERLRHRFSTDPAVLDRFIDYMLSSGWDANSIESVVSQSNNFERPPMQAFLHGGGSVLDQLLLNQGTYTYFLDSNIDPNFALRFPAETETVFRRLTPGDLLMLDATHRVSALRPMLQEDDPLYWQCIWQAIYHHLFPEPLTAGLVRGYEHTHGNPWLAAVAASELFLDSPDMHSTDSANLQLSETFMRPNSRFYTGVEFHLERTRIDSTDRYGDVYRFYRVRNEEALWFFASIVLCYAVDNYARDMTTYPAANITPWFSFTDRVKSSMLRMDVTKMRYIVCPFGMDANNGDQAQVNSAERHDDRILRHAGRSDDGSEQ